MHAYINFMHTALLHGMSFLVIHNVDVMTLG